MPRKKVLKQYPKVEFDKSKEFPISDFSFSSGFDIYQKSESEIVLHYQEHQLVHKFCPNTICQRYPTELILIKQKEKRQIKWYLQCPVCKERFPCRPKTLKNLWGGPKMIYMQLYTFCLRLDHQQAVNFLGCGKQSGHKVRHFRKRAQSVIIMGLETENKKLGGGVSNPVITDEMQKGVRRSGNGKQKSKPTRVHGDVQGACDNDRYRFEITSKESRGPPRFEQIDDNLVNWLLPDSTVMTDGAKCYITFQEKYPQLVPYLMQLNHSVGEWARRVTLEGKKMTATTNKIDGAWSHLRRFFSNHNVSQADAFRYLKEFEFFFGQWAKSQNSFERMLYYMQLDFEIKNIKGPELADAWVDYSKSNISFVFKILKEKRTFPQFFVTKTQHN